MSYETKVSSENFAFSADDLKFSWDKGLAIFRTEIMSSEDFSYKIPLMGVQNGTKLDFELKGLLDYSLPISSSLMMSPIRVCTIP